MILCLLLSSHKSNILNLINDLVKGHCDECQATKKEWRSHFKLTHDVETNGKYNITQASADLFGLFLG